MKVSLKKSAVRFLAFMSMVISNTVLMFGSLAEAAGIVNPVSTGDEQSPLKWILIILGCALVAVAVIILIRRKNKK